MLIKKAVLKSTAFLFIMILKEPSGWGEAVAAE